MQQRLKERVRLSPRVDRNVVRLAKSKAAAQEVPLEWVVEKLLAGWVAGRIKIVAETTSSPSASLRTGVAGAAEKRGENDDDGLRHD